LSTVFSTNFYPTSASYGFLGQKYPLFADFAIRQKHLEHLVPEYLFNLSKIKFFSCGYYHTKLKDSVII
jgi:hypothetical protein